MSFRDLEDLPRGTTSFKVLQKRSLNLLEIQNMIENILTESIVFFDEKFSSVAAILPNKSAIKSKKKSDKNDVLDYFLFLQSIYASLCIFFKFIAKRKKENLKKKRYSHL